MADIDWMIRGPQIDTCNCAYGCPCQFNSLPTYGNCHAAIAMEVEQGHFGTVSLDGMRWAALVAWPGPIHEGHGEVQPIIDARADERQRDGLLAILSGQHTDPGATVFQVFSALIEKRREPLLKPIEFRANVADATAWFRVDGVIEASTEPIRNPVTGEPHRAKLVLPNGMEFTEAEFASGNAKATGPIPLEWTGRHSHLCILHMTGHGLVR